MNASQSPQEEIQGMLKRTIRKYVHGVVAWLGKRFPERYHKHFWRHKELVGVRFYIFFRFGFDKVTELEDSVQGIRTGYIMITRPGYPGYTGANHEEQLKGMREGKSIV